MMTPAERIKAIRSVLIIELILNLLVAFAKGAFGLITGSLVITTDGIHSLVDAGANIVGFFVLGVAAAPPDEEHPYGHHKLEVLAATALGLAIGAAAIEFGREAISALIHGREAPATSLLGFGVILGTLAVNVFVATYEARKAKQLKSTYLEADAAHTASDVAVTCAVLVAYAGAHYGVWWADPFGAVLVIAVIARVAWKILAHNLSFLVDTAVIDAKEIVEIAMTIDGVHGCHRVRSRGVPAAVHVDMHLLMGDDISLACAHHTAHEVEEALMRAFPNIIDIVAHMEPEEDGHEDL